MGLAEMVRWAGTTMGTPAGWVTLEERVLLGRGGLEAKKGKFVLNRRKVFVIMGVGT